MYKVYYVVHLWVFEFIFIVLHPVILPELADFKVTSGLG
jgi:hypothetical protein